MKKVAQKRPTIGVLAGGHVYYGTILGNFIGPLLHGVCAAANDRQCNVLLACGMNNSYTNARPAWPVHAPDVDYVPVGSWNTDGLIVFNPLLSEARSRYIQELISAQHPIIFATAGEVGPTIFIDNEGGIRQALLHLMAHGHRHIAFIAGHANDVNGDSGIRLRAFQTLSEEYNLTVDEKLIAYGNHGISGGQQAMREILNSKIPFTAVLASNDESAIGAMVVLKEAGLRIPQDVAIIGFDDTLEAMTQVPPLTTLHGSPFRMGYQALESLLNYLEGVTETIEDVKVPMQLVLRQSCGCQPSTLPEFVFEASGGDASSRKDERAIISQLARSMTETVQGGAQRLSLDEVRSRCRLLAESFVGSIDRNNSTDFRLVLEGTLARIEEMEDDTHVWYTALSTFESGLGSIREIMKLPITNQQPEKMINEARAIIIQSMQRQSRRSFTHQKWLTDQMGHLNARLFAALDETQVYKILANHLPRVGIQSVGVAFLEAEGDDPVAMASFRKVAEYEEDNHEDTEIHFPSRQFPPPNLYAEPYSLVLLPIGNDEESSGFIAFDAANLEICANIVWQLVTFLKVVRLYRDATDGRRLAEEATHLKSRFLSTVSHELRTPLNLIVGLSGMLLQDETASDSAAYWRDIKRIHASAQHLDGLIQDVLDLSRDEIGQLKLVSEPLELEFVLKVVSTVGEQLVRDKGLEWQAHIPDELPKVWGDRTRLRQIVLNLISNAVKFTARGKVTFRVSVSEKIITISVSDTGLGIAPEEQGVIFDEFRQTERTKARGYGGLGLGLAICKRLVEMHGGHISVRSSGEEGSGSTFYFTLPVMEGEGESQKTNVAPSNQSVLLLAERLGNGEQLGRHLSRQGFDVETAWIDANTDRISRWLESPPGAVVLEQGTATRQGFEILQLLKENPATQDIPVLFYSLDGEQNSGSMLELNYLTKPMNKDELIRALDRHGLKENINNERREKTVLVVDDDPGTLDMHVRIVAMWSDECRILKARNGKEALAVIRDSHPDLVLLDLMMPEMDGFGVLEAIRSDERTRDIPVLVLTGQALTLEEMAKLNRGVTNVLGKGLFSMEETLFHVEAALARSKTLGNETQRVVRKAIAFLYEHFMEPISLDDAARYVGMSKEYLARCFHQEMGVTLVTYLNRYRVKQAKAFLDEGEHSLTEVALEIGFSSNTYFSRVFKQEVGMSPSEYKQISKQLRIQEKTTKVYPS